MESRRHASLNSVFETAWFILTARAKDGFYLCIYLLVYLCTVVLDSATVIDYVLMKNKNKKGRSLSGFQVLKQMLQ